MKKRNNYICLFNGSLLIVPVLVFFIYSCDKLDIKRVSKVRTGSITDITSNSCTATGIIIDKGEENIEEHGHCWSETQNPSIRDSATHLGYRNSSGIFTSNLTGLSANTTYYIKAYSANNTDTVYGNEASFTTNPGLPSLTTAPMTSITETTAISGGNITNNGGTPVTARGICWSTSQNPTIADSKTEDGAGAGDFESNLTGLTVATNYYVRAYATNNVGTAYGNQVSFASLQTGQLTDIENNVYNSVTIGTQIWMKENLKVTKTNDNTSILNITGSSWETSVQPAYCWYNNEKVNYGDDYGALYNWYAVNTGKLCPVGWHVPGDEEWRTLVDYLGGENVASGKLKETGTFYWQSPNSDATNESGFSALGGGQGGGLVFLDLMITGRWWSANEADYTFAWGTVIFSSSVNVLLNWRAVKQTGLSVRCLKNN